MFSLNGRARFTKILREAPGCNLSNNCVFDSMRVYIFHSFNMISRTGVEGHFSDQRSIISICVYVLWSKVRAGQK